MNHVITIKDVILVGGCAAVLFGLAYGAIWYLAQINSDI